MLGVMYVISRDTSGIILVCNRCSHTEHVNQFDGGHGSRRMQAAGDMLKHVRNEHGKEPIWKPLPQTMERW